MGEDVIGAFGTGNMTAGGTENKQEEILQVVGCFLYVVKFGKYIDKNTKNIYQCREIYKTLV